MYTHLDIEQTLREHLNVDFIRIIDESFKHAGHNEAAKKGGTHYQITIVSKDFEGKTLVARHRMVQKILESYFQQGLHALALSTKTPSEI